MPPDGCHYIQDSNAYTDINMKTKEYAQTIV